MAYVAESAERFWSHVEKGPGCWPWTASTFQDGRGQFKVAGRNRQAHRVAWELTHGRSPSGMLRSRCGNLRCVRPDHQVVAHRKVGPVNLARTPAKRFEAMVTKGPGCWLWTGSVDHLGYGQFSIDVPVVGKRTVRAHRFSWEQARGPLPPGGAIIHKCGIRLCVRPDHLEVRIGRPPPDGPTPREIDVLRSRLAHGFVYGSLQAAAADLGINYKTAAQHLANLRRRIGVSTDQEAVRWLDRTHPGWRGASSHTDHLRRASILPI